MMHMAPRYWWCIAIGIAGSLYQNWDWIIQRVPSVSVSLADVAIACLVVMYLLVIVKSAYIQYLLMRSKR